MSDDGRSRVYIYGANAAEGNQYSDTGLLQRRPSASAPLASSKKKASVHESAAAGASNSLCA